MTTDKTLAGARDEHVVVPFSATADDAAASFDNGLERLELRADEDLQDLLNARFAEPYPVVWATGQDVQWSTRSGPGCCAG